MRVCMQEREREREMILISEERWAHGGHKIALGNSLVIGGLRPVVYSLRNY